MPKYPQETGQSPAKFSDILSGDGHYIADRKIGESQSLVAGELVGLDTTEKNWVAYNNHSTVGIVMVDVTTDLGEEEEYPVCQSGAVLLDKVTGVPASKTNGSVMGLLIFE